MANRSKSQKVVESPVASRDAVPDPNQNNGEEQSKGPAPVPTEAVQAQADQEAVRSSAAAAGANGERTEDTSMGTKTPAPKKTKCEISRKQFKEKAPGVVSVTIDGKQVIAEKKEFSTGSLGWYFNGNVMMEVDGKQVKVNVGMNLTIVGSKELSKD